MPGRCFSQLGAPAKQLLRRQPMASSHGTDRIAARHDLRDDLSLVFVAPLPTAPGSGEDFQPPARLPTPCFHSKPSLAIITKPQTRRSALHSEGGRRTPVAADPFSGAVYVFRAKWADRIKLIFWDGILQVDGYAGYAKLAERGDVELAFCWAHMRRNFYELATPGPAPIASEALKRIAEIYPIEKDIRGRSAEERRLVREQKSRPLAETFQQWLGAKLGLISQKGKLAD